MGKEMFDLAGKGWRWYNIPDDVRDFLCREGKFDASSLVKINPVRAVFACGDFFVKFEVPDTAMRRWRSIFAPKAAREYAAGKVLEAAGIPVVEYVGWMRKKAVNVVVSRRWEGGSGSVEEYIFKTLAKEDRASGKAIDFARDLCRFTINLQKAGFHHPDYHAGNIMCSADGRDMVLVDVYGVKKNFPGFWERMSLNRILLPLRPFMTFDELMKELAVFPDIGSVDDAEDFYWKCRRHDREAQLRAWPKRQQQILSGYPKLVKMEDGYLIRKDENRVPVFTEEKKEEFETLVMAPEDAFALFQASIYLQLCGVRHRRAAAWLAPDKVLLEPSAEFTSSASRLSAAEIAAIKKEAAVFGITDTGSIACDKYGTPCIYDLQRAFESMEIKSAFY